MSAPREVAVCFASTVRRECTALHRRTTACIEKSVADARRLGHNYIGTEHLLPALWVDATTLAAQAPSHASPTYDDVRDHVVETLKDLAVVAA